MPSSAASADQCTALAVRRTRELAPALPTVYLMDWVPPLYRDGTLPFGAGIAGPGIHVLRKHPGFVRRVQERGHRMYVWTVNEPADVQLVIDLRVDGIITDRPAYVLETLTAR